MTIETKPLYKLVEELTEVAGHDQLGRKVVRFRESGNLYRIRHLPAIDNHRLLVVPIIEGVERTDLEICDAPSHAYGTLLRREGVL